MCVFVHHDWLMSLQDGTVRVWNVLTGRMDFSLSGHSSSVTCLKWTGDGLIVTGSQDRTIKVNDHL